MNHNIPPIAAYSFIADVGYPSEICSSIFINRCNLRCPFCINRDFVIGDNGKSIDIANLLSIFTARREKKIVISGGEPYMHPGIFNLCRLIKSSGMQVAVATNGFFPRRIVRSMEEGLVDHVIMDVKADLDVESYSRVTGRDLTQDDLDKVLESIEFLRRKSFTSKFAEFRTTVCGKFVSKETVFSIAKVLGNLAVYFLQPFTTHQTLDPELANPDFKIDYEVLESWIPELEKIVWATGIREV